MSEPKGGQQASELTNAQPQAPITAPPDVQAQGAGVQKLRYVMSQASGAPPAPATIAQLIQQNPTERAAMVQLVQQTYGNAYTQSVLTATQATPSGMEPSAVGAPGNGISAPALPQAPKNPGDKMSSGLTDKEKQYINGVPSPPASVYGDNDPRDGAQRLAAATAPAQPVPAPGQIAPTPDYGSTQDGVRTTVTTSTTNGPLTTTNTSIKGVMMPGADQSPAAQAAALSRYRAAVSASLDEQIAATDPKKFMRPAIPSDPQLDPQKAHDDLVAAKAKVATATKDELDTLVSANKLPIDPKDDLRVAVSVTNTQGVNAAGVLDGSAIAANNTKTAVVTATPGGNTVTKTTDSTNEISTKGVNVARGQSTTTVGPDGTLHTDGSKQALTGGITDPLKYAKTTTTADQNAAGGKQVTTSVGATAGNGFAGGTAGVTYNKLDPAKNPNPPPAAAAADPNAPAPAKDPAPKDPNALQKAASKVTAASASGQVGVVNNDNGVGAQASLNDARADFGGKQVAAGAYGSADATMQMLVAPTDDGGCTITLTYVIRGKAGGFAGKRDPNDPVTSGNEAHGGADVYGEASHSVTKSRKLSKDEATAILGDLDKLSSNVGGKKTFGVRAEALAYTRVFGGSLSDLGKGGEANKDGETVQKIDEIGGGADGKLGGSTGEGGGRSGLDVSGGYEKVAISGYKEQATKDAVTRSIVFGGRTSKNATVSGSEGPAGMSVGGSTMEQNTRTYVFTVPKDKPELLAQVRAIKDEAAAKQFAKDHPELATGKVDGQVTQDGSTVGANLGPIAVKGGTTSTVDQNVASGQHTEIGPDGKPVVKKDLSGTVDGTRKDDASLSVAGVKLSQGSSTTTSHGTVGANGQASLDVTTGTASSTTTPSTIAANAKALGQTDKADVGATLLTGGPMALVKKLAEKVGETNTIGAHFDDEAFNQLVGIAQGDQKRWSDAILVDYRSEWFALRNALVHPSPPQAWLDQDDSEGHIAAMQLARMKAFGTFVSVAGEKGQAAISRVRGEYGANAIGQTVSWPPSLQDQKPVFDSLAKQVEGLRGTLLGFAQSGNEQGGKDLMSKLTTDLTALHDKIQNAPDHSDPTLGVRAANGVGDMIQKVAAWQPKFSAAVKAAQAKQGEPQIEAALDGKTAAAPASAAARTTAKDKEKAFVAQDQKTDALAPPAPNASDKEWAEYNKKLAASVGAGMAAKKDMQDAQQAAVDQEAAEAKAKAEPQIPAQESAVLATKGIAFGLLNQAVGAAPTGYIFNSSDRTTYDTLMKLGTLMHEWQQEWDKLHDLYKDAQRPAGTRDDLRPGLSAGELQTIQNNQYVLDNTKGYAGDLKNQWGRLA